MRTLFLTILAALSMTTTAQTVNLRLIETSDVHGCFFPYDFTARTPLRGSLARVASYVDSLRKDYGPRLLLLENGDILQGQPTNYYYNYIATGEPNVASELINYMRYDAQAVGNHDIEAGHAVYDKWIKEVECPVLAANMVKASDGKPYTEPYTIIEREGVKVAILGMITPAIPNWLSEDLWSGLRFEEMVESARKWVKIIQDNENPDLIVGLFHSGLKGGITTDYYVENVSERIAKEVEGFDIIFYGHDHMAHCETVKGPDGRDVWLVDPSNNARLVGDVSVTLEVEPGGHNIKLKTIDAHLADVCNQSIDADFMAHFASHEQAVKDYVGRRIGTFASSMSTRDCFFGPSAFTDLIHNMQLQLTGADISFNAPLTFDSRIEAGDVYMSDMFKLYRYENKVYVLRMKGSEIRGHLEKSYDQWTSTMHSADDHIMLLDERTNGDSHRYGFKGMTFNFDSAAGIDYEVDVTKPDGQKVKILRMSDGRPFDEDAWYKVVMNSYRGNGGGQLLTLGAGIAKEDIEGRIIYRSDLDQRYYLTQLIEQADTIHPKANNNWRFVPTEWTEEALKRDRHLIFGD